jgi:cell division septation protein DedD
MPTRVEETSSLTLVESLMSAIPDVEGASLVARIGERATIVTPSGNIDAGSIELTVDAIDELIAQVLPLEQLQLLLKAGTVQFDLTPSAAVDGAFTVLAASAPGDRWLEIRRRSAIAAVAASEADAVAQLLARSATVAKSEPAISPAEKPAVHRPVGLSSQRPTEPVAQAPAMDAVDTADDDLAVPANLGFPARSDFARDTLMLSEAATTYFGDEASPADPDGSDRDGLRGSSRADNSRTRPSPTVLQWARRRRRVLLTVVPLSVVALFGVGWAAGTRLRSAEPVSVQPAPALRKLKPITGAPAPKRVVAATLPVPTPAAAPSAPARVAAPIAPARAETPIAPAPKVAPDVPTVPAGRLDEHPRAGFSIQVAAVRERDQADKMLVRLVSQGYAGYLVRGQGASADFYRVRVGEFADRKAAEEAATRLERDEWAKPWILKEGSK